MAKPVRQRTAPKRKRAATLFTRVAASDRLVNDLRELIEAAREHAARAVNSALVGLYWQIGKRIREDILRQQRAEYGEQIVSALSAQLTAEYGRGFDGRNLFYRMRFAELFPDEKIVNAARSQSLRFRAREGPPLHFLSIRVSSVAMLLRFVEKKGYGT
jgi:hypothetical protein